MGILGEIFKDLHIDVYSIVYLQFQTFLVEF